jgi:sulfur transfer complex TusBCD TusB component (DsrH family)
MGDVWAREAISGINCYDYGIEQLAEDVWARGSIRRMTDNVLPVNMESTWIVDLMV